MKEINYQSPDEASRVFALHQRCIAVITKFFASIYGDDHQLMFTTEWTPNHNGWLTEAIKFNVENDPFATDENLIIRSLNDMAFVTDGSGETLKIIQADFGNRS